jgi:hypothetical protein
MCAFETGLPTLGKTGLLDTTSLISERLDWYGPHGLVTVASDNEDDGT